MEPGAGMLEMEARGVEGGRSDMAVGSVVVKAHVSSAVRFMYSTEPPLRFPSSSLRRALLEREVALRVHRPLGAGAHHSVALKWERAKAILV